MGEQIYFLLFVLISIHTIEVCLSHCSPLSPVVKEKSLCLALWFLFTVVRCVPRLYAPAGGTKFCTKDNIYGSECSFSCHIGYTRVGSSKRVCEKNRTTSTGFWTGKEAQCECKLTWH